MELHHGWGSCLARRSVWTRSMHQGASVPSPRTAGAPQVHSAPAFSTGDNPTLWCTMHSPLPKCNVLGINNVWGISVCDLPLLQLSVTSRMVAEKWPHKKAIKEHKGSESRAQCDISRKWDICVHGARPTSDMFTRVQGGAGATQTGCGTSLLGRDCSPLITPRRETRLHEKGCRGGGEGKSQRLGQQHMWRPRVTWEQRLRFLRRFV